MGSFSVWHWLIVLLIVVLVFGTKKLKNIGSDLGGAVKGFKDGVREGGIAPAETDPQSPQGDDAKARRRQYRRCRSQDQGVTHFDLIPAWLPHGLRSLRLAR